jgi:DNA-binding Lrp family transcriptional regulator
MRGLSAFEKRLCNALQNGLPIRRRPFAQVATTLGSSEGEILKKTRGLVKRGVIRRLGVVINWRALGKESTLVTAHIEKGDLRKIIKAVNKLEGVSHNYLRGHHYNLWFTLRADSQKQIATILKKLSKRFGSEFHSLPVTRPFKLDVRFDAESGGKRLLPGCRTLNAERCSLSAIDEEILKGLQGGLKVVRRPFEFISEDDFEVADGLLHIEEMIYEGVISRLGAIVNHHKLGFVANAMFVCKVGSAEVVEAGQKLAKLNVVSHCYERKPVRQAHGRPFKGWPYNLYAMMHGRCLADIRRVVEKFVREEGIKKWELLITAKELKKGNY